jgi:hypothetical protein
MGEEKEPQRMPDSGSPWGTRGWSRFCEAKSLLAHASWIAAEIPQDLHRQIRGIGAESPVFCEAKNVHRRFGKGSLAIKKILNRI